MGNWQERIRQILEEEKREVARKAGLKRQMTEEQETKRLHAARDKQLEEEARSRESFKILKELQVQELLEKVKQDVWHVGTVKLAHNTSELRFDYESAEYPQIGWNSSVSGIEGYGGGYPRYGDKGHIIIKSTHLGVYVQWLESGPILRILYGSENYIPRNEHLKSDVGGYCLIDFKHPQAHQWIEELFLENCVWRTKNNCLPLDLKVQGKKEIERIVPWHNRVFRKRE